ncbi:nucleotidyltransferase domain-containing protein [Parasphingorhabdus sp.]|uniref:nucleotidyltransferase domain-containing protein n=1 Tax=Parasphingorhabdus sp. TaxID=2709688 RepID=UPI0032633F02
MSRIETDGIPANVQSEIESRLARIEAEDDVRILMAIESGSRAWGFPSPDSDYDVRFVFVRKRDWYLSLSPGRDVIEQPIVDEIDLNGWDIRKALGLLLKSNAVISEWIESPIRYRKDHSVIAALGSLADGVLDGRTLAHHYANLGRNNANRWIAKDQDVPVKKYFYSLRPALAIRFLRKNPGQRPPMDLQALIDASNISRDLVADIDELVEAKKVTNEKSNGMRKPAIDLFINDELGRASEVVGRSDNDDRFNARAEKIFLELVNS